MTSRTEITNAVREWKAQRAAELRLKVKLLQQELLWAIDDLQQHNKLQGEALFLAANNEGVAWNAGSDSRWLYDLEAAWNLLQHAELTADERRAREQAEAERLRKIEEERQSKQIPFAPIRELTIPTHPALSPGHTTTDEPTNQAPTPHDPSADETHALVPVLAHR
jgi:hypothetical protein